MDKTKHPPIPEDPATPELATGSEGALDVEIERLKIEERKVRVDEGRLEIERDKATLERRWARRNVMPFLPPLLPVIITCIVSYAGVRITTIVKDKEIEADRLQQRQEFALTQFQQDREWKLEVAKFVTGNAKEIFGGNREQQKHIADVIAITFPSDISEALLKRLEPIRASGKSVGPNPWAEARKELKQNDNEAHIFFTVTDNTYGEHLINVHVVFTSADTGEEYTGMTDSYGKGIIDLPVPAGGSSFRVLVARNGYKPRNQVVVYQPGDHQVDFSLEPM